MEAEIPGGWFISTLDQFTRVRGKSLNPQRFRDNIFELYSVPSFESGRPERLNGKAIGSSKQVVEPSSVLLCKINPRINRVWLVGDASGAMQIASTEWIVFPYSKVLEPKFLQAFLSQAAVRDFLAQNVSGVGGSLMRVKASTLKGFPLPVPPLNEQRRIVEKIETLFAQLGKGDEALQEVQTLLARYRHSVLKDAVTGKLTAEWRQKNAPGLEHGGELLDRILQIRRETWQGRGRYKEPVAPDTTDLPDLPDGWAWASIDQILRAGLSNGRSVPDATDGFPVLRLTALKDGRVDVQERKIGAWNAATAKPFLIERGDILVSRGNGSKKLVGRGGLVEQEPDPVAYPDTMIRIPISLGHLSSHWFLHLWNSPFMRSQIEVAARTTAGIYKINQTDIRNFVVPLPPLAEQKEVAVLVSDLMNQADELASACRIELARSSALRQSILKDAFAGRLVPQDPADEPAHILLGRIKKERADAPKQARRKRSTRAVA